MKSIKQISFSEMLLIPSKDRFMGDFPLSYYWGSLKGTNGNDSSLVYVMIFNCLGIGEIPLLVDKEIENLKKHLEKHPEAKDIVEHQTDFFSNLKKEIETPALYHDAPQDLIYHLVHFMGFSNLKDSNLIFLSGVSYLLEVEA
jgi:hypothetical protein